MKNNHKIRHILLIIAVSVVLITLIIVSATALTSTQTTASFTQQFKMGNIAVADFNTTDGISLYSKSSVRNEQQTPDGSIFTYEGTSSGYPRVNNKEGIFISGTYDNSTIVFYLTETDAGSKSLSVKTRSVDEADYFADINSDRIESAVSIAVFNEEKDELCWRPVITNTSSEIITTDIDYEDCSFDEDKNAYMIALRVDTGMTVFDSIQLSGLSIATITDCRKTLFYKDGILMQGDPASTYTQADSDANFNLDMIKYVTECTKDEQSVLNPMNRIEVFLKNLCEFLLRFINNVLSMYR